MNSRICLLLLAFLYQWNTLQGQEVDIQWGAEIEENKARPDFILGDYEGAIFAVAVKEKKFFFQRYDENRLSLDFEKEIVLPKLSGKDFLIEQFYLSDDNVIVFYSDYEDKKRRLYAGIVDKDANATFNDKPIYEVEAESKAKVSDFDFRESLDDKYLGVGVKSTFKKGPDDKIIYHTKIFDGKLKEVNSFDLVLEKQAKAQQQVNDFCIDNDGNVHILHALTNVAMIVGVSFKELKLTTKSKIDQKVYTTDIESAPKSKETTLISPLCAADLNGDIIVTALFTEVQGKVNKELGLAGNFVTKISGSTHNIIYEKANSFSEELKPDLSGVYYNSKSGVVPNALYLEYLYFNEDGTFTLFYEFVQTTIFGPIVLMHYSKDGDLQWIKVVYKYQNDAAANVAINYSMRTIKLFRNHFYSYLIAYNSGNIGLIFNDVEKNIGKGTTFEKGMGFLQEPKKGVPLMIAFDKDGKASSRLSMERNPSSANEVKIRPGVSYQIDGYTIIVYGSVGGKDKLGRITFTLD